LPDKIVSILQDDLVTFAMPLFLLAVLLEAAFASRRRLAWYSGEDFAASMGVLLLTVLVDLGPKIAAIAAMFALYEISPFRDLIGRQWWAWLLLFFLDDFIYYWFHRSNHELRFMWAGHVSHHSSRYLNFGTALRQGVGERVLKYFYWLPLPLLGFDPVMVVTMMSLSLFYQFWIHTRALGKLWAPIELVFNTPSHHRVHHASNIRYLDCNHGGTLIIWDRLFGTFSEELAEEPVVYGLTDNIQTSNPWKIATNEYAAIARDMRRADRWRDRLRYLLSAPGWSHDGPDKRARTLRRQQGVPLSR
jgi:sterol desaturase/sphingolipid hydroxylase (fatty acid hydroxylase superfamily)